MYDGKIDTTKSRDSERRIPIPPALLERMNALDKAGEWIFHGRRDVALNPGNALKRHIRPVAKELEIDLAGWHDFRHTVATSLLRRGHGVKVVSQLLGHSDVAITLRTYDHVESDAFRAPFEPGGKSVVMRVVTKTVSRKINLCKPLALKRLVSAEGITFNLLIKSTRRT